MLSLDFEHRLLRLAVNKGLLPSTALEAPAPALDAPTLWGPRLEALMTEGRISRESVEGLAAELARTLGGDAEDSWMAPAAWTAPAAAPEPPLPSTLDGRYQDPEFLGEGATAQVYKAFDTLLRRWVALKLLKPDAAEAGASILEEARAQAQVEHPNVCRIYEVGEHEGRGCIAMQLAEGPTLARAFEGMDVAARVRAVRDVAEGVHAAHLRGLVHLDLKPGNVLMQPLEGGGWRPLVSDFGMVRAEAGGPALCPMGTPPFCSPEQVRGQSAGVDRRSDVYSLGVTLYVLLARAFPFEEEGFLALLDAIEAGRHLPLRRRRPEYSEDLEAILQKCMERDPSLRYATAQELAEDLDRVLRGAPVAARPLGLWARALHRVRRCPRASAGVALGGLLVLGTVGALARRAYLLEVQRLWTLEFGQEAIRMEGILHDGRMLRPHDLGRERALVQARMEQLRRRMARDPAAQGPGHWALGLGQLLLGDGEQAEAEARLALARGYDLGPVHQALGEALLMRYQAALRDMATTGDASARRAQAEALARQFRAPALEHLRRAQDDPAAAHASPQEVRMALAESRVQDAMDLAQALQAREPWNYEPLLDVAEAKTLLAVGSRDEGRLDEARSLFLEALRTLAPASEVAPSDARIHRLRAQVWLLARDLGLEGRSAAQSLETSLGAADAALEVDPLDPELSALAAKVLAELSLEGRRLGKDPAPWLDRGEVLCRAMLARPLSPRLQARAHGTLSNGLFVRAHLARRAGRPFEAPLREAVAEGRAAVATGLADWPTYWDLAMALSDQATQAEALGQGEPLRTWQEAESLLAKAVDLAPSAQVLHTASWPGFKNAEACVARGEDPSAPLRQVFTLLDLANRKAPAYYDDVFIRAKACRVQGSWAVAQGRDPWPDLDACLRLPEAPPVPTRRADRACEMAEGRLARALTRFERGEDPEPELAAGEALLASLEAVPEDPAWPQGLRADLLALRARGRIQAGRPALPELQALQRTLAAAKDPEIELLRAALALREGWEQLSPGSGAQEAAARAQALLTRLGAREPGSVRARLLRARLPLLEAAGAGARGPWQAPLEEARTLLAGTAQAGRLETLHLQGALALLEARLSGRAEAPAARQALDEARRRAPGLAATWALARTLDPRGWSPEESRRVRAVEPMLAFLRGAEGR